MIGGNFFLFSRTANSTVPSPVTVICDRNYVLFLSFLNQWNIWVKISKFIYFLPKPVFSFIWSFEKDLNCFSCISNYFLSCCLTTFSQSNSIARLKEHLSIDDRALLVNEEGNRLKDSDSVPSLLFFLDKRIEKNTTIIPQHLVAPFEFPKSKSNSSSKHRIKENEKKHEQIRIWPRQRSHLPAGLTISRSYLNWTCFHWHGSEIFSKVGSNSAKAQLWSNAIKSQRYSQSLKMLSLII